MIQDLFRWIVVVPQQNIDFSNLANINIVEIINRGIAYAIILAGLLCVFYVIYGGIKFILSGGDDAKIKEAVGTIRHAIIGLIITVLAVVLVATVGKALGLDIIRYIDFGEILNTVQNITGEGKNGTLQ
ncbi:hypothetical protein HYV57_05540 [Candidatus Peregrinibacteria bacterium]|nr:hypothetical protein [Candidatus Peregrinibacteria bacterium]